MWLTSRMKALNAVSMTSRKLDVVTSDLQIDLAQPPVLHYPSSLHPYASSALTQQIITTANYTVNRVLCVGPCLSNGHTNTIVLYV